MPPVVFRWDALEDGARLDVDELGSKLRERRGDRASLDDDGSLVAGERAIASELGDRVFDGGDGGSAGGLDEDVVGAGVAVEIGEGDAEGVVAR